jgi:hypothetical protein
MRILKSETRNYFLLLKNDTETILLPCEASPRCSNTMDQKNKRQGLILQRSVLEVHLLDPRDHLGVDQAGLYTV